MSCPTPDQLLALSDGALEAAERQETAGHVLGCDRCHAFLRGEEWIALGVLASPAGSPAATGHPDEILLASFAEGGLPEAERRGVLSHLAACGPCRGSVVALTRDLARLETVPTPPEWLRRGIALGATAKSPALGDTDRARERNRLLDREAAATGRGLLSRIAGFLLPAGGGAAGWLRPVAVAAGILLAVAILPRLVRGPGGSGIEGAYRSGGAGGRVTVAAPAGDEIARRDLADGSAAFAWTPLPGAASYRVVLGTDSGAVLAETTTTTTTWNPRLPADTIAGLDQVLVWVEARAAGSGVTASPVRTYRLR